MFTFRLGRVRVGISIWFTGFFAVILFISDNSILLYGLLAMLIHELGHMVFMIAVGCQIRGFYLLFGRLVIVRGRRVTLVRSEILILVGGIAANLLFMFIFFFAGNFTAALINLAVAVYNALPAGELDGGAVLLCILSRRYMPKRAFMIHLTASFAISLVLMTAGFFMLLNGNRNVTALFAGIYIMVQNIKNLTYKNHY